MNKLNVEALKDSHRFMNNGLLTKEKVEKAIEEAIKKIDHNMSRLGERFPSPNTINHSYQTIENVEWTTGFWTGMLWLAYEYTQDEKYKQLADKHVDSFLERIEKNIAVDHHDMGFLFSPSCVASYKLTGNKKGRKAGILAADKLMTRYQEKGKFIQAWGELGTKDNYRLIVDCLLNIPLLYWASEETGDPKYSEVADKHYQTTIANAIREDASAFHTFYFDPETGKPVGGRTRQGYADDSSWARGQSWLIYGIALNYNFRPKEDDFVSYEAVTNYFLNRLPKDLICYWDLIFDDQSQQSRDSSTAAIAVCGMNLMNKYLPESFDKKQVYTYAQHSILESLIDGYTEQLSQGTVALINHGVYSWHSGKGVDEGNIWGDYYYLEALIRFYKDWKMYW